MDRSPSAYVSDLCGDVSYKFIEKCHFWPNRFSSTKFSRDEEAQKVINASKKQGAFLIQETLSVRFTNPQSDEEKEEVGCGIEIEKKISGPAFINKLDDDSLIAIFSYLPIQKRLEIENVCIRWRDVARRSWHGVRELEVHNTSGPGFYAQYFHSIFIEKVLAKCGVYLKTLKLHLSCPSYILRVIGKYCHNLTTIKLAFTDNDVKHYNALSKMQKLQSFAITNVEPLFVIDCLRNLPKTIKSIHIDVANPTFGIFDRSLLANISDIFEEFNALDSLTMKKYFFRKDLIEAISKNKTVTKLDLTSSQIEGGLNLLTNLSNLEYLDLRRIDAVDNNFLAELSTKCRKLKYLDVSYCEKLSDEGIRKLKDLINLKVLLIDMPSD